jgi:hypothetical protein
MERACERLHLHSGSDALQMLGLAPVRGKAQRSREADSDDAEKTLGV